MIHTHHVSPAVPAVSDPYSPAAPGATAIAGPAPTRRAPLLPSGGRRRWLQSLTTLSAALIAGSASRAFAADAAAEPFRVAAIPDESPTELLRKFKPLGAYLQGVLNRPVEFFPTTDYAATVEALIHGKVDMAWLGGFTFIQAKVRSDDKVIPIIQRTEDAHFRSVFIARAGSGIRQLADLKGKTLSFGSPSSTSGHLMPRYFLMTEGKLDPERDLGRIAYSGAHDATAIAVASGRIDAGALNISVWEKLVADGRVSRDKADVFYTTPEYPDYNWTVHKDMPEATRRTLIAAFEKLDPAVPADQALLSLQRTVRFIPTSADQYARIEEVARSAGLLK